MIKIDWIKSIFILGSNISFVLFNNSIFLLDLIPYVNEKYVTSLDNPLTI